MDEPAEFFFTFVTSDICISSFTFRKEAPDDAYSMFSIEDTETLPHAYPTMVYQIINVSVYDDGNVSTYVPTNSFVASIVAVSNSLDILTLSRTIIYLGDDICLGTEIQATEMEDYGLYAIIGNGN